MICTPEVGHKPTKGVHIYVKTHKGDKSQAIELLEGGMPVRTAARELGVSAEVVRSWHNRYQSRGLEQLLCKRQSYTATY